MKRDVEIGMSDHSADVLAATAVLDDLSSESPVPGWRGFVDEWSPARGVAGWAFEVGGDARTAVLEFWIGNTHLATASALHERDDVARAAGRAVSPGFVFLPSIFELISRLDAGQLDGHACVRIAGGGPLLQSGGPAPTGRDLIAAWREHVLQELSESGVPRAEPGQKMLQRLMAHRHQSSRIAELALTPIARHEAGRLESIHVAPSGKTWFVGWMKRTVDRELPAVIVDRQKFPCGLATAAYERVDLPGDSVGVVGLMDTSWAPAPRNGEFFVYLGPNGQQHLRAGGDMQLLQWQVFRDLLSEVDFAGTRAVNQDLLAALVADSPWEAGNSVAAGFESKASVDRAFVVPGFGCLVEGWIISPARRTQSLALRIGQNVMHSDNRAFYLKPRPDLQELCGGSASAAARAGFVTAFLGDLPVDAAGHLTLQVTFSDGLSSAHSVDNRVLRMLDPILDSTEVLRLFPSIGDESFFDDLHSAMQRRLRSRSVAPVAIASRPVERLLVLQCAESRDERILQIDEISDAAERLVEADVGVALVANRGPALAEVKRFWADLGRTNRRLKLSLFVVDEQHAEPEALPFILVKLGAQQFVYLGSGLVPTPVGWAAMLSWLQQPRDDVIFFETLDDLGDADDVHGSIGTATWGWKTPELMAWARHAPRFVRGVYKDNGILNNHAQRQHTICRGAVTRIGAPSAGELADVFDERALKDAMQS